MSETPASRQLSLLGGFELRCAGEAVAVSRSGQRLLALLALHGRPLERLYVAGQLWLDALRNGPGPACDRRCGAYPRQVVPTWSKAQ